MRHRSRLSIQQLTPRQAQEGENVEAQTGHKNRCHDPDVCRDPRRTRRIRETSTSSQSGNAPAKNETPNSSGEQNKPPGPQYTVSQENAIKSAEQYLSTTGFSKAGLIEQLSSSAGSKYTVAQAEYAAKKVGLC